MWHCTSLARYDGNSVSVAVAVAVLVVVVAVPLASLAVTAQSSCNGLVEILQKEIEHSVVDAPELVHFLEPQQADLRAVLGQTPVDTLGGLEVNGVNAKGGEEACDEMHLAILHMRTDRLA